MPCLLLSDRSLVKSVRFEKLDYVGDPFNAIRIFNELEVDELILLDIKASQEGRSPDVDLIRQFASECFMPLTYGGGVSSVQEAQQLFRVGVEKVSVNHHALENPSLIGELADQFGSQSVVVALDVRKRFLVDHRVYGSRGTVDKKMTPVEWLERVEARGAGEILLMSIDRDGTWDGYDLELVKKICSATTLPVIVCGGAGRLEHFGEAFGNGASAAAAGSMVVYQKKGMGVLINYPTPSELESVVTS